MWGGQCAALTPSLESHPPTPPPPPPPAHTTKTGSERKGQSSTIADGIQAQPNSCGPGFLAQLVTTDPLKNFAVPKTCSSPALLYCRTSNHVMLPNSKVVDWNVNRDIPESEATGTSSTSSTLYPPAKWGLPNILTKRPPNNRIP